MKTASKRTDYSQFLFIIFTTFILIFVTTIDLFSALPFGLFDGTIKVGVRFYKFDNINFKQFVGTFSVSNELGFVEEGAPYSGISYLNIEAGRRFGIGDSSEIRGKIKLLDIDIFHESLIIGGSLINVDKAGFMDEDIQWFSGRIGFAMITGSNKLNLSLRIMGTAAQSQWVLGKTYYPEIQKLIENIDYKGLETGYLGGLNANLGIINFITDFSKRIFLEDPELTKTTILAAFYIKIGTIGGFNTEIFGAYEQERIEVKRKNLTTENSSIQAGIQIGL